MEAERETASRLILFTLGHTYAPILSTAAFLKIPNCLAEEAKDASQIAALIGANDGRYVERLLNPLVYCGIFTLDPESRRYSNRNLASLLIDGRYPSSISVRSTVINLSRAGFWDFLPQTILTGRSAFEIAYGERRFAWLSREENREHQLKVSGSLDEWTDLVSADLIEKHDFTAATRIVDVGSGYGRLALNILRRYPHLVATLYDLPHVAQEAAERLMEADVGDRCQVVAGDIFDHIPDHGDTYLLKSVLNSFSLDEAKRVLANCRQAMRADSKLVIIEGLYPTREQIIAGDNPQVEMTLLMDLYIMATHGGQQMTAEDLTRISQQAGLKIDQIIPTSSYFSLIVCSA